MMDAMRAKRLATLRREVKGPETLSITLGCAGNDAVETAVFERGRDGIFRIVSHAPPAPVSLSDRLRTAAAAPAARIDVPWDQFEALAACLGCGRNDGWVYCPGCHALVCRARTRGQFFVCRPSCATGGKLVDSTGFQAAAGQGAAAARDLLTHHARKLLTRR